MSRVRLSGQAYGYLRAEAAYLRDRNPIAAKAFLARMTEARTLLARFPEAGFERAAPPVPGLRRLVVGDYLMDYALIAGDVVVLAIRHSAQAETPPLDADFDYEA